MVGGGGGGGGGSNVSWEPLGKNVMRVVDFRTPGVVFPIPGVLLVL